MRDDNVTDYPWLCFSPVTLMREYSRMRAEGARSSSTFRTTWRKARLSTRSCEGRPDADAERYALTGISRDDEQNEAKEALGTTLMGYARANPHKIRGRLMPFIVYDPAAGRRAFCITLQKLKQ